MHTLDLRPSLTELFHHFHKDCVQRKIRRAEREGLVLSTGRSQELLESFYRLLVLTRRRQHLPPQPFAWFRNLVSCMGKAAEVLVVSKEEHAVAAILTLRFRNTLTYKYGASERESSHLGGMQRLFWRAIEQAKNDGVTQFDLGRSDLTTPGLVAFKERLGAARQPLTYWRYPGRNQQRAAVPGGAWRRFAGETLARLPAPLLIATGRLLYRHSA
jgi:lipid II:glycine glycyltransferase (peptidoglycan interpeptide bridge formation enzyme)